MQASRCFIVPAGPSTKLPFLSYASGAYLGRLAELIVKLAPSPLILHPIYETDMAEGLKAMALEGHGLAFLPVSSVKKELKSKRLVRAETHVRFCERLEGGSSGRLDRACRVHCTQQRHDKNKL